MTRKIYILAATGGSAALLLGALAFQFIGGLAPCPMCLWQRWPHLVAVLIGLLALRFTGALLPAAGALAALVTAAIGAYHAGVEQGWWPGPSSCTGDAGALTGLGGADLLSTDAPTNLVMCDEIVWSLAGISMAGWNAIVSALLVVVWLKALRVSR
ncbi:disulfide bond formation protein B [Qingshengfaniella alkalisoli]|uniref:Disulfide bond formation protein B n=1 Tax=Qingshengfaniella alkalisoli TaxID=2599296 RepID=A0A5B8I8J2_9RHOB|nr:disulfide bond formation protein B [Qingshengfaniella alkalisoli]QDY69006.1 disulfide bond formation protein B [Qingshengfaniella alkalisoli]